MESVKLEPSQMFSKSDDSVTNQSNSTPDTTAFNPKTLFSPNIATTETDAIDTSNPKTVVSEIIRVNQTTAVTDVTGPNPVRAVTDVAGINPLRAADVNADVTNVAGDYQQTAITNITNANLATPDIHVTSANHLVTCTSAVPAKMANPLMFEPNIPTDKSLFQSIYAAQLLDKRTQRLNGP